MNINTVENPVIHNQNLSIVVHRPITSIENSESTRDWTDWLNDHCPAYVAQAVTRTANMSVWEKQQFYQGLFAGGLIVMIVLRGVFDSKTYGERNSYIYLAWCMMGTLTALFYDDDPGHGKKIKTLENRVNQQQIEIDALKKMVSSFKLINNK